MAKFQVFYIIGCRTVKWWSGRAIRRWRSPSVGGTQPEVDVTLDQVGYLMRSLRSTARARYPLIFIDVIHVKIP
jgi:hypothetical protein